MEQKILKFDIGIARDIDCSFTYTWDYALEPGQLVSVDFRGKDTVGIVLGPSEADYTGKLKKISAILPYRIHKHYLKFAEFVSAYNIIKLGTVLSMLVPFSVDSILLPEKSIKPQNALQNSVAVLNEEQKIAASKILAFKDCFKTILLHGVTGSGKTEVYLSAAREIMDSGFANQILILVPEIALSNELAKNVASKLGCDVYIWHNTVPKSKKLNIWKKALAGEKMVVVGARSALFIPFSNLGLVIVDEEHDSSFKQNEGAIYNARDMSVYLSYVYGIPLVLSSATPSVESYYNAISGKYEYVKLSSRYYENATLPSVVVDDLKQQKMNGGLSEYSVKEIRECLSQGKQALVFINRRGHTPKILCRSCGEKVECPACSSWLCYHADSGEFVCHYCGFHSAANRSCSHCGGSSLIGIGAGIEKLQEECARSFPDARIMMLSSDTINTPNKIAKAIDQIENNEVDLILGTQIVAKGHNFNNLKLVVVTCADAMLYGDDFRSIEKAFQLLYQVSGRAGRTGDLQGKVIIQTYNPDDKIMRILENNDIDELYRSEIQNRKLTKMPPFGKMVSITISALSESEALRFTEQVIASMPRVFGIKILGPVRPAIYKLRSRYRFKILILSDKPLQHYIQSIRILRTHPRTVKLTIDIDPQEF